MTARLRLSCDGAWPQDGRPAEACRGALSLDLEAIADAAGLIGTDVVDVDAARDLAADYGWSSTDVGDYCPAHTARQARALAVALGFDLDAYQPAPPRPSTPIADATRSGETPC